MANYLRIIYHCHVLQIHHVDCPAISFSRTSCHPVTGNYTQLHIYKTVTMNHAVHFMVHSRPTYLLDLLHECHQLPLEFIA